MKLLFRAVSNQILLDTTGTIKQLDTRRGSTCLLPKEKVYESELDANPRIWILDPTLLFLLVSTLYEPCLFAFL